MRAACRFEGNIISISDVNVVYLSAAMFVYPMVFPLRIKYIVLVVRCYHRVMEEDKITEARARNHKTLRKCLWMETIKKRERNTSSTHTG